MESREGKNIVSRILEEKRNWTHTSKGLPNPEQRVVIRMVHESAVFYEDETKVYPAEDMKIGRCVRDGEKIKWVVDPPFPKFDYSPLTHKSEIADGVRVTHWAVPEDGELDAWDHRFDINMHYNDLHISTDPENEELVYRAIMWGASFLGRALQAGEDNPDEIKALWVTLCDLQSCFDQNIEIKDGNIIQLDAKEINEKSTPEDFINELKRLAKSSENICKGIASIVNKLFDAGYENVDDMDYIVSRLWVLHDMLVHEFRKRTVKDTPGVDMDKLPPMFFQKLGEEVFNAFTEDERKRRVEEYISEYVTPYENKEE